MSTETCEHRWVEEGSILDFPRLVCSKCGARPD